MNENEINTHHNCALGKWYFGFGKNNYGNLAEYISLEEPHAHIHQVFGKAVADFNSGDKRSAESALNQIESLSKDVVSKLDSLEKVIAMREKREL